MKIDVITGARPNFMKVSALFATASDYPQLYLRLIHTGQHYDVNMSDVFIKELHLPKPHRYLGAGSGSHAQQTAKIMLRYEESVQEDPPDLCVVVGDVNSTVACALVAAKMGIPVAHVEAGLRSFDRTMPEEINRVLTDSLAELMFVTEPSGTENLLREGRPAEGIHMVGNTMIDTLFRLLPAVEKLTPWQRYGLEPNGYVYLTLHRPSNLYDDNIFDEVCSQILWLSERMPVIFLVHPRTRHQLAVTGWHCRLSGCSSIHLSEPVGYLESLALMRHAKLAVTDSGGIQEETTALGIPCLTLRENTERPITVEQGTNTVIDHDWELFRKRVNETRNDESPRLGPKIEKWDGKVGRRIMDILACQL